MSLRPITWIVLLSTITLVPGNRGLGEDAFRQIPPLYSEAILPLLTPASEVLEKPLKESAGSPPDAVALLNEEIHFFDASGARYNVFHHICKALTEAGAKAIAEDTWSYRKASQKIHLALAQTILPDGKRVPLAPSASILQSPQRQASDSMYNDDGELQLIFPNIKPGSITESIIVIKEDEFRIPGEFTTLKRFAWGWPIETLRYVIEMPSSMTGRLKLTPLGGGVPEPQRRELPGGRVRLTWKKTEIPTRPYEASSPPTDQAGPALYVTTLPDWDAFVRWYHPLVQERSEIAPPLAARIDEWTRNAKDKAEVLEILSTKVAREIRYVSLAFGTADLQPYDCNTIWENQYGDCKDKSTLLRAMLRHKGIDASLVLLNTEDTGRIEKSSPDYRQFNHAILAVYLEPGNPVFCDPTISYAKPGLLSPGDADRDGLLIGGDGAKWVHTPAQDAGKSSYEFDLKLAPNGELSGWITKTSSGYFGALNAEHFSRLDKDEVRLQANSLVQSFFPGAETIDVTRTPLEQWSDTYALKAYFIVPSVDDQSRQNHHLVFPQARHLFYDFGAEKKRQTPYYLWPDTTTIDARISLPEGIQPAELPRPLKVQSDTVDIAAEWEYKERQCIARLELRTKQSSVSPDQFPLLFNSHLSLRAWLDRPLGLTSSPGAPAPSREDDLTVDNFPMMATGEGQIDLVDRRFPFEGNSTLRREALLKTLQYFPFDKTTQFLAKVRLAWMDRDENGGKESIAEVRQLLKKFQADLIPEHLGWGEYILASMITEAEPDEARKIYERLRQNSQLSDFRRAWAAYKEAIILETNSRDEAIKVLRASQAFDAEASPYIFALLVKLLAIDGRMAEARTEIGQASTKQAYEAMLLQLAQSIGTLLPETHASERDELMSLLTAIEKSGNSGKAFSEALDASRAHIQAASATREIKNKLLRHLEENPESKPLLDFSKMESKVDFSGAIAQAERENDSRRAFAYAFEVLVRFELDADFPFDLWNAARCADWSERQHGKPEPLLPVLLDLCDLLPHDNDYFFEGRFLRGQLARRNGGAVAARELYESILKEPALSAGFRISALIRLAGSLEELRLYKEALDAYRGIEPLLHFTSTRDSLFRAVLLNLERDNRTEALRLLSLLRRQDKALAKVAKASWQIENMLALTEEAAVAQAYWDASGKWWPEWLKVEEKLKLSPLGDEVIIPAFVDPDGMSKTIETAIAQKDTATLFFNLRMAAHGARWQPYLAPVLLRILNNSSSLLPDAAGEIRQLSLALHEHFESKDPMETREIRMLATIMHLEGKQYDDALKIIRAYYSEPELPDDAFSEPMARLWALLADEVKSEAPVAITALEKSLAGPQKLARRKVTVQFLADLYKESGRAADEQELLAREMEHPDIKAVPADLQALTERHSKLTQSAIGSKRRIKVVEQWLAKYKPAWFDFAEPKSLDDPRLSNLDAIIENGSDFTGPEYLKIMLLIASDPDQPFERWDSAFSFAAQRLADLAPTREQARRIIETEIDNPDLPEHTRFGLYWSALMNAFNERDAAHFDRLLANSLYSQLNEKGQANFAFRKEALALEGASPKAVSDFCLKIIAGQLTSLQTEELQRNFARLLELDALNLAEEVYQKLSEVKTSALDASTLASLQMDCLKALKRARFWSPVVNEMREIVLRHFPNAPTSPPAGYEELHDRNKLTSLDEATATQARLYQIKTRQVDLTNLSFWAEFIGESSQPAKANDLLMLELAAPALKGIPDDREKSAIILILTVIIDIDDPTTYEAMQEMIKPFRDTERYPATYETIVGIERGHQWRTGESVSLEPISPANPASLVRAQAFRLKFHLQKQDTTQIRQTLESLETSDLLSERFLLLALRAFKTLGMDDELTLAKRVAAKASYHAVLEAWATPEPDACRTAYTIPLEMDDPSLVPEAWVASTLSAIGGERARDAIRCADAALRKDWNRLLAVTTEAIHRFPTLYRFHWYKGAALYHLGRFDEAVEPLKTYARYSKNEQEYPQCMAWLEQIAKGEHAKKP